VQELAGGGLFGDWPTGLFSFLGAADRLRGGVDAFDSDSDQEIEEPVAGEPMAAAALLGDPAMAAAAPAEDGLLHAQDSQAEDGGEYAADAEHRPARRRALKAGTGKWFLANRAKPIAPDHPVTIIEACHWLATLKSSSRMTDDALDKVCQMIHKFLLPEGNLFPPSYHIVKATLGVDSSAGCTDHICDKCWSVFPRVHAADFAAHEDDVCQATGLPGCLSGPCGNPRFSKSETGVLAPNRSFYQFDVTETVRDLLEVAFSNLPEVLAQRRADFEDPATFWGSPAGAQLDAACGHKFSIPAEDELAIVFALGATCVAGLTGLGMYVLQLQLLV